MSGFISWVRPEPVTIDPNASDGLQARVADPLWMLARQIGFDELAAIDGGSPIVIAGSAATSQLTRMRTRPQPDAYSDTADAAGAAPAPAGGANSTPAAAAVDTLILPPFPGLPLELLIEAEAEPVPAAPGTSSAATDGTPPVGGTTVTPYGPNRPLASAQAGLHYLRMLRAAGKADPDYIQALTTMFPIPAAAPVGPPRPGPPPAQADDPMVRLYTGLAPDGQALHGNLSQSRASFEIAPDGHPEVPGGFATVADIAQSWLDWYDQTCSLPAGQQITAAQTWWPNLMEYAADLAAPGPAAETVLRTGGHTAGALDWYHFDLLASSVVPLPDPDTGTPPVSLGAVPADTSGSETALNWSALPTPASYAGAPNSRWWAFEDAAVNFGDVSAAAEGSVTVVVVEFALRYGTDHFVIPVPVRVGSLTRVGRLVVTTTFGERILIRPVAEIESNGPFRVFELSGPYAHETQPRDPVLVLFPAAPYALAGQVLERVTYDRDEISEIVWGIEHLALGPDGGPYDRNAAAAPATAAAGSARTAQGMSWQYQLRTETSANWYPFTLPNLASQQPTKLPFADPSDPTAPANSHDLPWGAILAPQAVGPTTGLPQEEVTRAGLVVARAWRYARWIDGSAYAWVGRTVDPGTGEADSGLTFDRAVPDS